MKKVLYVTNLPAPYKITFFTLLSKEIDLTVVYERKKASDRDEKWESHEARAYQEIFLKGKNIGNEASLSFEIIRILKQNKYDIVMMNGYSSPTAIIAILYMKIMQIRYAIICDGMLPNIDSSAKYKLKSILIKSASFYLSSGQITDEQLVKYGAKYVNIYRYPFSSISKSDIGCGSCNRQEFKRKVGCKTSKMLLYVGQFIERKGLDILFKSIENLKVDFTLFMVGGNMEQASSFEGYDNPRIKYIGFKTKEELTDYYRAADVFVLPTREDIWGLVVNEAMAFGLPVITTKRCGAGLEMIQDGINGFTFEVNEFSIDDDLIDSLTGKSQYSIATAEKYTIENMNTHILNAINRNI